MSPHVSAMHEPVAEGGGTPGNLAEDDVVGGDKLYHEDLLVGRPYLFPSRTLSRDEIVAFASAYDPQPPHIAEDDASAGSALCAAPLHTCAIMMRMFCDGLLNRIASLGSPGVDEVRWLLPVRPGEVLCTRCTLKEKRDLASRPDVGMSRALVELLNGEGEVATSWITNQLVRRRSPGQARAAEARKAARPALVSLWDNPAPAAAPACDVFFEDSRIGETTAFGSHAFCAQEIIAFARRYDPQPFHIDAASAKASLFGALCASGWHTAAIFMRKSVAARVSNNAAARARGSALPAVGPSPAWRDLRWPKPVYAGDVVDFRARISDKAAVALSPDRGLVSTEVQGRNQRGETVFAFTSSTLIERREPLPA
jgi:acyl dehydratase